MYGSILNDFSRVNENFGSFAFQPTKQRVENLAKRASDNNPAAVTFAYAVEQFIGINIYILW